MKTTDIKNLENSFKEIINNNEYKTGISWGKPRRGHPEATIGAHILELEENLSILKNDLSEEEFWKLKILIHVHDTFKGKALRGSSILDKNSHASLAADFLSKFIEDQDLINMVQYHDEGYALWKQYSNKGRYDFERFVSLANKIENWRLFLIFNIIDNTTVGKSNESLLWFFTEFHQKFSAELLVNQNMIDSLRKSRNLDGEKTNANA